MYDILDVHHSITSMRKYQGRLLPTPPIPPHPIHDVDDVASCQCTSAKERYYLPHPTCANRNIILGQHEALNNDG